MFESASLGPGAQLCGRQRLCLIVLGTASVATWVIQSACSSSPSSTHQIELFPHLHTDREECGLGPNRSEWIRASYACRKRGLDKHHDFEIRCSKQSRKIPTRGPLFCNISLLDCFSIKRQCFLNRLSDDWSDSQNDKSLSQIFPISGTWKQRKQCLVQSCKAALEGLIRA